MIRAFLLLLGMTLLTGIVYPVTITFLAETFAPEKSQGSFIHQDGRVIGSRLIAQRFTSDRYFWPRPSAIDYNPLSSGGSDLGQTSAELTRQVQERRKF
ncbi:MAG: potassium-transporting ATPase subunit C, partial [Parachlamydia sp.]|nr:potassium-transporting ATPase subunit C [Parachlamydia sp.]